MFRLLMLLSVLSLIGFSANASPYRQHSDDVHVNGYSKKDGTYVEPHYRRAPNSNHNDY
jgi:hypothetical protein